VKTVLLGREAVDESEEMRVATAGDFTMRRAEGGELRRGGCSPRLEVSRK